MKYLLSTISVFLGLFVLIGSNTTLLEMPSMLPCFGAVGLILVFLTKPALQRFEGVLWAKVVDWILVALTLVVFGYIFVQNEKRFEWLWVEGVSLGDRAGIETTVDFVIGAIGLLLVLEATRRAIGWTLPILSVCFLLYAMLGPDMPDWAFPHGGFSWKQIAQGSFLQSTGVFGIALEIMFKYVFLFVLFGTLLEQTGATGYIIDTARKMFRNSSGGPAKVAVVSSGLMGSLSGSAVANTATTGTFTIPLMKSSGFNANSAGGIEAAASSGGALMPPIMGAGAYMMMELVPSEPKYLEIIQAALLPAILYYLAVLLTVHFHAKRIGALAESDLAMDNAPGQQATDAKSGADVDQLDASAGTFKGIIFVGSFLILIGCLVYGLTPFLAVTIAMGGVVVLSLPHRSTVLTPGKLLTAFVGAAKSGVALIVAASCVGIILAIVNQTGLGNSLPPKIIELSGESTIAALLLLMVSTIVLGMGLPSAVCYLLMATLVKIALSDLPTPDLAAHLFIFYFGMMSMVTPPVALAAYAAAAISKGSVMGTAFQGFRFALVGFALPFFFVLNPELLMLTQDGEAAVWWSVVCIVLVGCIAIYGLSASLSGHATGFLGWFWRGALLLPSLALFFMRYGEGWYWYATIGFLAVSLLAEHFLAHKKTRDRQ